MNLEIFISLYLDIDTDLVSAILAYALSRNEIQFLQSLNPTVRRMRPYLDIANLFARKILMIDDRRIMI